MRLLTLLIWILLCQGCQESSWNDPYPNQNGLDNIVYSAFAERPKHLDPVRSYSSGEWTFISQIYEPLLQYHYLKRPYELIPLMANELPSLTYYGEDGNPLPMNALGQEIKKSVYAISIRPEVYYQPHPAFAKKDLHTFFYHNLNEQEIEKYQTLFDFKELGTREVTSQDYILQIKRIADPKLSSPIYGFLSDYIIGLKALRNELLAYYIDKSEDHYADLRAFNLQGVIEVSRYHFEIHIQGKYPQFQYWLAMPFFSPIPYEAIQFYHQPGMSEHNIHLDWYPIGTGPYMLTENNPERRMVLKKNPNFHGEYYPKAGEKTDQEQALLDKKGQALPFVDEFYFSLEKEDIPYWNKFLQGYYDNSGISSDNFDQAIDATPNGGLALSQKLQEKGIRLQTSVSPTIMYWAFNMLDDVIGGYSESSKKIRQAISIAFDTQEFITIFINGRGEPAQGPIPPGIFGYQGTLNPVIYKNGRRKSMTDAKMLLVEAGYPNGRHHQTGEPLVLHFEAISSGDPDEKSVFAWLQKQLAKIDIQLVVRATDYNRFREKMDNGDGQMFFWGWNADYPDPENFLFMFYGPNGKVKHGGENAANYDNKTFDHLFEQMKAMDNSPERNSLIARLVGILQEDAPWIFGYHPQTYSLSHQWMGVTKPHGMAKNTLKYVSVNPAERVEKRKIWNQPLIWPFFTMLIVILVIIIPAVIGYLKRETQKAKFLESTNT